MRAREVLQSYSLDIENYVKAVTGNRVSPVGKIVPLETIRWVHCLRIDSNAIDAVRLPQWA